jgi:hypothetical protein
MIKPKYIEGEKVTNKLTPEELNFPYSLFLFFCHHSNGAFSKFNKLTVVESFAKFPFFIENINMSILFINLK